MCPYVYCVLLFLCLRLFAVQSEPPLDVKGILRQCQSNINSSIALDKNDRLLMTNWTAEFQVKQVNITAHYRLEMAKHREHSFKKVRLNTKWNECLRLHNREIRKTKVTYFEAEAECLKVANSGDKEKRRAVSQVEKEIKKWRKSYKYLSKLCDVNNPGDADGAESCLAQYIKNDNYDSTFERLIILKLDAMSELLLQMDTCLVQLENCLRMCLTGHLTSIRGVMENLGQCYGRN
ncbi:unnamed protein product, partial [Iphiclides podalirius]